MWGLETRSVESFPVAVMGAQVTQQSAEFCSELSSGPAAGSGPAETTVTSLSWG